MSIPVVLANDVEGGKPISENKKRSTTLDSISLQEGFSGVYENGLGLRNGEFILPSGESYVGTLLGNAPHGRGKYIWSDGCIYEGEWRMGMRHGIGKILWASGSVYEGEFSGGYMHGNGKFVGQAGSYDGRWKLSRKHGLGFQSYSNGDVFEGSWIQGAVEGPGKYIWANGNVYAGHMKGGKMSGKGTLTWSNGDSYEGSWSDSMAHGFGIYTWAEGDSYVGTWTRGLKDGKGVFYPKGCKPPVAEEFYVNALRKRGYLQDVKRQSHGSRSRILHFSSVEMGVMKANETQGPGTSSAWNSSDRSPTKLNQSRSSSSSLERGWSLEVAFEKILGLSPSVSGETTVSSDKPVDLNFPILEREYVQGVLISELVINDCLYSSSRRIRRRQKKLAKEKKQGETIIKGHRSYDLMLSLQLGIRYTVGKITPIQRREVRGSDFGPSASFWMNFPKTGSQLTPSHHAEDFKWKDYCPMVFRNLREMFKLDAADYMVSVCGSAALRELSSPGKSGSVFFLSQDDRFMIKTLRKSEVKVFLLFPEKD